MDSVRVDTAQREVTVTGEVNDVSILEFVANTRGGFKAYESALTLDASGVTFNTALLLIGLDPAHARVPTRHFDDVPPKGDPVEIWVEWKGTVGPPRPVPQRPPGSRGPTPGPPGPPAAPGRVRIEQLLLDKRTNQTMPEGPWVYTGSTIMRDGHYMADLDGVLIGFVHSPSPVIENPRAGAVNAYGAVVLNRNLGLLPKMPVTVTVKAISGAVTEKSR